jgi:polygalacturonase
MTMFRRDLLKLAPGGLLATMHGGLLVPRAFGETTNPERWAGGPGLISVKDFGAKGDGSTIDTNAINMAIETVSKSGGGTVRIPAGTYMSFSIHLKSSVVLYLEQGATLVAADTPAEGTTDGYDAAEENREGGIFQDFGHSHWHNSLIWGENLHDIAIVGPGKIWGKGLTSALSHQPRAEAPGAGNKALALKDCHNVVLRDFSILQGGHFGILATGLDNLTIDNLKVDTNRDGIDIDCCRNVRVSNCYVNSPYDDGICLKSSFALGYPRGTENVTITNCYVTGFYEMGTMLDGSYKKLIPDAHESPTGRIKCGTESNGGFKSITISNCIFDNCRGFALESVDGAALEDIVFSGITMQSVRQSPLFLRLGSRMRGPEGTPVGTFKRIKISDVISYNAVSKFAGIISGIPGHPIEDVTISDVYMHHQGGGTDEMAAMVPPEEERRYPEPDMFGPMPAHGFFVRHAKNIEFRNVEFAAANRDQRPVLWARDVDGLGLINMKIPADQGPLVADLRNIDALFLSGSRNIKDMRSDHVAELKVERS